MPIPSLPPQNPPSQETCEQGACEQGTYEQETCEQETCEQEKNSSPPKKDNPPHNTQKEIGGPRGLEPTRYGDWEKNGRCYDF